MAQTAIGHPPRRYRPRIRRNAGCADRLPRIPGADHCSEGSGGSCLRRSSRDRTPTSRVLERLLLVIPFNIDMIFLVDHIPPGPEFLVEQDRPPFAHIPGTEIQGQAEAPWAVRGIVQALGAMDAIIGSTFCPRCGYRFLIYAPMEGFLEGTLDDGLGGKDFWME